MIVHIACERCDREIEFDPSAEEPPRTCPGCGAPTDLQLPESREENPLERCLKCGGEDFYQITQINPNFGLATVILGVLLFLAFVFWMPSQKGFLLGMAVLLSLAVVDRILRLLLPEVVICYRCKTVYSHVDPEQRFGEYDHERAAEIKYSS